MLMWGGYAGSKYNLPLGVVRYNPSTDTWKQSFASGAPAGRTGHTAVWTGTSMIVWGGTNGTSPLGTGGLYDPATDTWTATSTGTNVPSARRGATAVWTGSVMVVWGGTDNSTYPTTGGRYNPSTNTWLRTSN